MKQLKLYFVVFLSTVIALVFNLEANEAFAQSTVKSERYYDVATGKWKFRKTQISSSKKSLIPRKIVEYTENFSPGTIIIDTSEYRLYYVLDDNKAVKYGVGVGRDGFTWSGKHKLTRKAEWPSWTPPKAMIAREKKDGRVLPTFMSGGPENPLGARALYIGSTIYRIHGTNQPWSIGQSMSSGCIRLTNEDITDLYNRVNIGANIIVRH